MIKRRSTKKFVPNFKEEENLSKQGYQSIAGIDEAGRGAWAGPLLVGVVVLPTSGRLYKLRDSKLLLADGRQNLALKIKKWAQEVSWGQVSSSEIDRLGLSRAIKLAALRAIKKLKIKPDFVLLDGNWNYLASGIKNVKTLKEGDKKSLLIAAASIIAKVKRDEIMVNLGEKYSRYHFEKHKGYGSRLHQELLKKYGPSKIHRKSFRPIKGLINQ